MPSFPRRAAVALLAAIVCGCAHHQPPTPDYDPLQPLNRKVFAFNDGLDTYVLEPVARGWDFVVPGRVQRALSDFFNNLRFPIVFVNDILQGKPREAVAAYARLQINTLMGGVGLYDLAADLGLPPQPEDTGQTLGRWDIAPGPYVVIPLLGPSNPRDIVGLVVDGALGFYTYFVTVPGLTIGLTGVNIVNERSRLIEGVENAKEASFDYYTFVRNAYTQRRWSLVNDQAPRATEQEDELYDTEVYEKYLEEGDEP